jgi:carboxylesterase type B
MEIFWTTIKLLLRIHSRYSYKYSYCARNFLFKTEIWSIFFSKKLGACHGDDIFYMFSSLPLVNLLPAEQDRQVSCQLVTWLASFARTGTPEQPGWHPVTGDRDNSFWVIDRRSDMVERPDLVERFARWTEVIDSI